MNKWSNIFFNCTSYSLGVAGYSYLANKVYGPVDFLGVAFAGIVLGIIVMIIEAYFDNGR